MRDSPSLPPKSLDQLGLAHLGGADAEALKRLRVSGLCVDSRLCTMGSLFAALPGVQEHGARYISDVLARGAVAILTDQDGAQIIHERVLSGLETSPGVTADALPVALLISDRPRADLAQAAARFYDAQPEIVTAVTGTNGKTSVAHFQRQIWALLGESAVNFGTTGVDGAYTLPLKHTTPEPITLHRLLHDLAKNGVTHAAMEASSHGLDQRRLDGVRLAVAGFTNFTQDHLDYHESFENYFDAKAQLFTRVAQPGTKAVINRADPHGEEMIRRAWEAGLEVLTIGRAEDQATLRLLGARFSSHGQTIRYQYQDAPARLDEIALIGAFQAENLLLAALMVIAAGAEPEAVFATFKHLHTVPGRMDLAATRANGAPVFVDYAHTPDALSTALQALRPHVMGRIIAVIGAGGDRDKSKRPLMGRAARQHADLVIVTDDNPRTEDPALIRASVMAGAGPDALEIGDRAQAIVTAVDALQPGDALLIAGKGHETGQIIGTDVFEFNDAEQASIAVAVLDGRPS